MSRLTHIIAGTSRAKRLGLQKIRVDRLDDQTTQRVQEYGLNVQHEGPDSVVSGFYGPGEPPSFTLIPSPNATN